MPEPSAADLINARIAGLADWRGRMLAHIRTLIHKAVPDVEETWKWRGVLVWERGGILCTGETYKDKVKLTFPKGAVLPDPSGLFNASLEGNARRAIDIGASDSLDEAAFLSLIRAAADVNMAKSARKRSAK